MNNRPKPDEYSSFHNGYVNLVGDEPILDILENLKESSYSFLMSLPAEKADHAYAEGKWTIKELVGHLIDAERTFAYRAFAFSRGQAELPGFEENEYVEKATFGSRFFHELVEEFRTVREANMYMYKALTVDQLSTIGIANGNKITVKAILYIAAGHEIHHLNIIREKYL